MTRTHASIASIAAGLLLFGLTPGATLSARQSAPRLAFREDWKTTPAETPVTQAHVANPDLTIARHGPGADGIKKSHHDQPADDPYYVWSGDTTAPWAVSLRHAASYLDLRGGARVRWRARQSGFHELRLIVKLADGTWLIADKADGPSPDWRVAEWPMAELRWYSLDIARVTEARPVERPDLSRVDEIGVTDLRGGGGTPASSRLDWIEVHASLTPRPR